MPKNKENTEEQILKVAEAEFQTKGMNGARMQEIADKAGINKAMLHYYYRSKQKLFEAVFIRAFRLIAPQINRIINDDISLFEKIRKFSNRYIQFILKHPYIPLFIINELQKNPEFVKKLSSEEHFPNIQKFKEQVSYCIIEGTIRPIQAEQLFINILSLNVFPFIGAPLLKEFIQSNEEEYRQLMKARSEHVSDFIINAIKK